MTKLVNAAVDYLTQQISVTNLLGSDSQGPWIFANTPWATIENTGTSMVVITTGNGWGANEHNTARFPTLVVDIWSDPTRNADNSVEQKDADDKIENVYLAIDKFFHLVNKSTPSGGAIFWGTASEISSKTGVRIISSVRQNEPQVQDALNTEGTLMGSVRYNLEI